MPRKPITMPLPTACERCAAPLPPHTGAGRPRNIRYCSRTCFTPPTIVRPCGVCGTPLTTTEDRIRDGRGKFCSRACIGASRAARRKGFAARFESKVIRRDGCWGWSGTLDRHGYGEIGSDPPHRTLKAHRVAWGLAGTPAPDDLGVLHTCDTPSCTRNDGEGWYEVGGVLYPRRGHLWLGPQSANMLDMLNKGRARGAHSKSDGGH